MKIGYRVVEHSTVVWNHLTSVNTPDYNIPTLPVPSWHPSLIYPGSVILLVDKVLPSPVTGRKDEVYIHWVDAAMRVNTGWISKTAVLRKTNKHHLSRGLKEEDRPMSAWDQMRWRAGWPVKFKEPAVRHWLFTYGREHIALLRAVVREWGGHYKKDDDAVKLIRQIVEQVFHETLERVPNMGSLTKKGPLSGREAEAAIRKISKTRDAESGSSKGKKAKKAKKGGDVIDLRGAKKPRNKAEEKALERKAKKASKVATSPIKEKAMKKSKKDKKATKKAKTGKPVSDKQVKEAFKRWKGGESLSSVQNDVGRSLTGPFIKIAGSKEAFFKLRAKGAGGRRVDA